jgi:hypothetical protein
MWLKKLKIAIIEKNTDALDALLDDIPQLKEDAEIQEAIYLLKEATNLVGTLKDETSSSMKQIKQNLKFLNSTKAPQQHKFDIQS